MKIPDKMKPSTKLLTLLAGCLFFASCGNTNPQSRPAESQQDSIRVRTVLYRPGDYDSRNYRIPAIITAKDGSLVVATDKRKYNDADLPEDIDIIINRSTDGGLTWSAPFTLMEGQGVGKGYRRLRPRAHQRRRRSLGGFRGWLRLLAGPTRKPVACLRSKEFRQRPNLDRTERHYR